MGLLINGTWSDQWYTPDEKGRFIRSEAKFRNRITTDGSSGFKAEAGRYHLYVSHACPWSTRTVIMRKLKGLENTIGMSVVDPYMGENGWFFSEGPGCVPDTVNHKNFLHEIYTAAIPDYTGRVTVPVLWDKQTGSIVSNESREIIRMLDMEFEAFAENDVTFRPAGLETEIDKTIEAIYQPINNGVYRAGFSTTQEAYEEAVTELFATLDYWDSVLGKQRFLVGDVITEADWCLFVTLYRFDSVYFSHFKCNLRRIQDYPNLWNYTRELYQYPGVAECCYMDHAKNHYYRSHPMINPTRIVPLGPVIDFNEPHDRDRFDEQETRLKAAK
jgi:putative glutathione S-transferase